MVRSTLFSLTVVATLFLGTTQQQVPSNNGCENAFALQVSDSDVILVGDTTNATNDQLRLCGDALVNSPGVWYRYLHSSSKRMVVRVSTCHVDTTFDTSLSLFRAQSSSGRSSEECGNLQCVNNKDDDTECRLQTTSTNVSATSHSTIAWIAEMANEVYYIQVHGSQAHHSGQFVLTVEEEEALDPTSPERESDGSQNTSSSSSPMPLFVGLATLLGVCGCSLQLIMFG